MAEQTLDFVPLFVFVAQSFENDRRAKLVSHAVGVFDESFWEHFDDISHYKSEVHKKSTLPP